MGWNKGYAIFEATVVGAYDLGKLDKDLLSVLMEPYRDTDTDSGGSEDLTTKDGKRVEQVVIEAWGLEMPTPPAEPGPARWSEDLSDKEKALSDQWDAYHETVYDLFHSVTREFGWR